MADTSAPGDGSAPQNGATAQTDQPRGGIGGLTQKFVRGLVGGVALVLILAALAWLLAAPRGELRLAIDKSVDEESAETARQVFQLANAHLNDARKHHAVLSFHDDDPNNPLVPMPLSERPNSTTLSDVIQQFNAEANLTGEGSSFSISVRVVRLMEMFYDLVDWHDFFVYVRSVKSIPCKEGQGPQCYQVVVSLSPFGDGSPELNGTVEEIASDVSVYVFRSVTLQQNNIWQADPATNKQPTPYLFAVSIPDRMAALENAAAGMDILVRGSGHPQCVTQTLEACVAHASDLLERATDPAQGGVGENPAAALGLSLIATEEGLKAARDLEPETVVQRKFDEAERWMQVARRSKFVRDLTANDDFVERFRGLELGKLKLDENFYKNTASFVCALESNASGRWSDCLKRIEAITAYPDPLAPYLEATKFFAELKNAADSNARATVIAGIKARFDELSADASLPSDQKELRKWSLQRILVLDGCANPDAAALDEMQEIADDYIRFAPGAGALRIAKLDVAGCAFAGNLVPQQTISAIEREMVALKAAIAADAQANPGPQAEQMRRLKLEELGRLAFALGRYRVRTGDYDQALELLKEAIVLPQIGAYVTAAPEFEAFMNDQNYRDPFLQAYFAVLPNLEERNC